MQKRQWTKEESRELAKYAAVFLPVGALAGCASAESAAARKTAASPMKRRMKSPNAESREPSRASRARATARHETLARGLSFEC